MPFLPDPKSMAAAMLAQALFAPVEMAGEGLHARVDTTLARASHLDQLAKAAQSSALRVHVPEMFKPFIAAIAPKAKVFVPIKVLTHQVSSPHGLEALRSMPEVLAQVPRAVDEGLDVEIPLADYAMHIAGVPEAHEEFSDHVRFEPGGLTRSEALSAMDQQIEQRRADYHAAVNQAEDPGAFQDSAQAVRDDVAAHLNDASPFTGQLNHHIAEHVAQSHAIQAVQSGVMPEEAWEKYGERPENGHDQVDLSATVASVSDKVSVYKNAKDGIQPHAGEATPSEKPKLIPGEGEVGTYRELLAAGFKGDGLTPHHIPSSNRIALEDVPRRDGIAMNMEHPYSGGGRHRSTFTYGTQADVNMAPRDALAAGIWDARRIYMADELYSPQIRSSLQKIISTNKSVHDRIFTKKKP